MKTFSQILVLSILFSVYLDFRCYGQQVDYSNLNDGLKRFEAADFKMAIYYFDRFILQNKSQSELYTSLNVNSAIHHKGMSHLFMGDLASAQNAFHLMLQRAKNDQLSRFYSHLYLGYVEFYKKNYKAAIEHSNTAINESKKDNVELALFLKSYSYLKSSNLSEAKVGFNNISKSKANALLRYQALFYLGNQKEAIEGIHGLLKKNPSPLYYYTIASLYAYLNDKENAIANIRLALEKGLDKYPLYILYDDNFEKIYNDNSFAELLKVYNLEPIAKSNDKQTQTSPQKTNNVETTNIVETTNSQPVLANVSHSEKKERKIIEDINFNKSAVTSIDPEKKEEIKKFGQNNQMNGSFIKTTNGETYIIHKNKLYKLCSDFGDKWCKITENIKNIAFSPENPDVLFSISAKDRICKSMDGGISWRFIENGIQPNAQPISLYINPHNHDEVFLVTLTGLYKTNDSGFSWQAILTSHQSARLQNDYFKKNKYYLLGVKDLRTEILLSTDGGQTWNNIGTNLPKVLVEGSGRTANYKNIQIISFIFYSDPQDPFLMAFTEKGVFVTKDDGVSWIEMNDGLNEPSMTGSIYLTDKWIYTSNLIDMNFVNPNSASRQSNYSDIKIDFQSKIYRLDLQSKKWEQVTEEIFNDIILGLIKDNSHDGLYIQVGDELSYIDNKDNIIGLNYGLKKNSSVRAFNITEIDGQTMQFAFIENNEEIDIEKWGLWQSIDNGLTWNKCDIGYCKGYSGGLMKVVVSPFSPSEVWAFDSNSSCNYSSYTLDAGKKWMSEFAKDIILDFSFDPQNKNILYFTKRGFQLSGLYRFDRTTSNSTHLLDGTSSFIISKDNSKKIITSNFKLSNDGGWTWSNIDTGPIKPLCVNSNIDNLTPLYYNGNYLLLRNWQFLINSEDNGKTWQLLKTFDGIITSVKINTLNDQELAVLTKKRNEKNWSQYEYSVFHTKDRTEWEEILSFTAQDGDFGNVYFSDFGSEKSIYVYGRSGMLKSVNNGETWKKIGGINE